MNDNYVVPIFLALLLIAAGCVSSTDTSAPPTSSMEPSPTLTSSPTSTPSPTPTPTATPTPLPPQNPWRAEVVTITIADRGVAERNNSRYVQEAVDYWNEQMAEYRPYEFRLEYAPDKFNADIIIRFEEIVWCDGRNDVWGCAPLIYPDEVAEQRTHIQIKTNIPQEAVADVITHELGHVLGLEHGEGPSVMAEEIEEIDEPITDATQRNNPFTTDELVVYTDLGSVPESERTETEEQIQHATTYVQDAFNQDYDRDISIRIAEFSSNAHITVQFPQEPQCRIGDGSCLSSVFGYDIDTDDPLEYYSEAEISVTGIDDEARGWHVGYWLAFLLYQEDQPLPNPLIHADYEERRDDWWNQPP